ncbi:hypothetical protein QQY24_18405 [Streptomyces sp. TG1A-8]|uniref:hypothetical protein n=1 Tax=Streptomyces sp. TG1A-8 TaxID=3051385 RepID=UPI00265C6201|nr:hypothetical protein [Streptomyces sp. TG1A-8]MDO0927289.1 hypothetical protein [Streptomyces sp. TG1A-8]
MAAGALFAAAHFAGFTLLGVIIDDDLAKHRTAAAPDTPLTEPDPPSADAA